MKVQDHLKKDTCDLGAGNDNMAHKINLKQINQSMYVHKNQYM